ncbi:MAG: adenosylcobalamin-dependent ribonucleoside-diphosphate reductase, partial [candidate division WOR-3 bacterium]
MIKKVIKRDGRVVQFLPEKIRNAIIKALQATQKPEKIAESLAQKVLDQIEQKFPKRTPSVENIQDIVEQVLIESGFADTAKAYILYRQKRTELRESKLLLGVKDDLKLSVNATTVLKRRYLLKNEKGEVIETPKELFTRVAKTIAAPDANYGKSEDCAKSEEEFFTMMANLEFLPNSPTLMNAGTPIGQLSACFVLPVEDSIDGIFTTLKNMALIHQSGGGTGFSFSRLRPKDDIVKSTGGVASGPVSFMTIFDAATEVVKQGGRRRGANMAILRVDHPDILEFIAAKSQEGKLTNFNISVGVTDSFIEAVKRNQEYELINPRTQKAVKRLKARAVFDLICHNAWATGDPGLIFLDEINRHNPTPKLGEIEATNPCGEQPLLPYESCNLGSINLVKMLKDGKMDWTKFRQTIHSAIHFLDNVIDANKFPLLEIEKVTKGNRKIGLGIMGFADTLYELGIPYNSLSALRFATKVASFLKQEAIKASQELAKRRGSFPNFPGSIWDKKGLGPIRNSTLTTIAPTGSLSIIAQTSSGIEPVFALAFVRDVMGGAQLVEINPIFEKVIKKNGYYSSELVSEIARRGSIQAMSQIPAEIRNRFVTALDIEPEWHIKMQATFQRYIDNAVSKTVNLPQNASVEIV